MGEELKYSDCRIKEIRLPVETNEAGVEPIITVIIEMPGVDRTQIKPLVRLQGKPVLVTFDSA